MSDQDKDNHTKTKMGPLQFMGSVFVGVIISVTLVVAFLDSIDQIVTILYLIEPFLPYYFAIGIILAFLFVFIPSWQGTFGMEIITSVIVFAWLPLLIVGAASALYTMVKMLLCTNDRDEICINCSIGLEDAGCESAGAIWDNGKWNPTLECIELNTQGDSQ